MVFQGNFKGVSLKFHGAGSFMNVSGVFLYFQGCFNIFKGVAWVSRVFPECFKEVSRKLSRCFKKVSCCMALIAASRAEGGLVGLLVRYFGLTLWVLYMRIWILCRQNIYNIFPILFFSRGFILYSTYIGIFSMSLSNYRKWSSIKPFWFFDQILESTFSDWILVDASSLVLFMWFVFVCILHVDSEIN